MTRRTHVAIALVLFSVIGTALIAGAQNAAPANAGDTPQLLPGLDQRLLDRTADPCQDFFKYACGNFTRLYPIPNDRSGYSTGAMVAEYTETVLHNMLDSAANPSANRTPNQQKIGDYYASCRAEDVIDKNGLKPLQPELSRIAALQSKDELTGLLAHYQLINVTAFFNFGEQQDFKDARKQIAIVDQGGLGLPERDSYMRPGAADEKTRQPYVQHIAKMLKLLGETDDVAASDAKKIMDLETALAKVSMDVTSQRDPKNVYHPMTVAKLVELTP